MSKNMQEGLLNKELTESDQILIIKIFIFNCSNFVLLIS